MKLAATDEGLLLSHYTPFELALLQVGSERSAVRHARKFYDLDAKTARLLVRTARNGTERETT